MDGPEPITWVYMSLTHLNRKTQTCRGGLFGSSRRTTYGDSLGVVTVYLVS